MIKKTAKNIGPYKANGQERIEKLVESIIDQIYEITEAELSKIYPEKNWFDDNFASNLFMMACQICSQIQMGTVYRRAEEVRRMNR